MWEKVKFTDVVKDVTGGNKKINQDKYLKIGKYPIIDQGEKFIGGYFDNDLTLRVDKPVIVFGDHSRCIKYVDFDFILGADGVKVLEPFQNLDSKYLFYFLKTIKLPNVGYSRHFKFLKESIIPLPPLPIQEKIAEILDKADELRRKDKDLQSKYDELSQAIFIDMFGDPVRNEKGWEVKKLEKYIDSIVDVGSNGANDWVSKNIQMKDTEDYAIMIRTTNLTKNDFINNLKYVSRDTYELFNKTKVYGGEMIMNKIGSAGDFWLMPYLNRPVSLGLNQLMIKISNINMTFLLKQMSINSFKKYIKSKTQGAITKSITKGAVKDLEIILPPIALQEEFAKKIDIINKLKAQANTAKSEELFQVLLQKAFKGDVVS
ncbi:Type I restriction-modification system, specificity subunit S [Sphingobacterium faecium PCAi_F2.5]|nr:Type I restriction-modification system, specificity subunit S [Sphingobacterium faecium PCAi_F2.5]